MASKPLPSAKWTISRVTGHLKNLMASSRVIRPNQRGSLEVNSNL